MTQKKPPADEDDDYFGLDLPAPPKAVIPSPPPPKPLPPPPPPPPPPEDTPEQKALLAWFDKMAADGIHPRLAIQSPKLVKAGKINLKHVTEPLLARAVRRGLPLAKAHAVKHNELFAKGKARGYIEIQDAVWMAYGAT